MSSSHSSSSSSSSFALQSTRVGVAPPTEQVDQSIGSNETVRFLFFEKEHSFVGEKTNLS
jgi:hypothetical protein